MCISRLHAGRSKTKNIEHVWVHLFNLHVLVGRTMQYSLYRNRVPANIFMHCYYFIIFTLHSFRYLYGCFLVLSTLLVIMEMDTHVYCLCDEKHQSTINIDEHEDDYVCTLQLHILCVREYYFNLIISIIRIEKILLMMFVLWSA